MKPLFKMMAATSLVLLTACTPNEKISQRTETFTIVKINPPKRMYVDLQDKNGQVIHKYVSKRCTNWRKIQVGSKINLTVTDYKENGKINSIIDVSTVCPR